jgi:hypothetical protein
MNMAGINLPTYGRYEAAITAREAQTPNADFDDGLNLGASNAPGIGINTGSVNPKLSDWSVEDQHENVRAPQGSQHIGVTGIEDGSEDPLLDYPIQVVQGADVNDTVSFIVALAQAAPGVGFGVGNADPINRTDVTIEIGDRAWGTNTVA